MTSRDFIVATFLAVLELCKMRLLRISQQKLYGAIRLVPAVSGEDGDDSLRVGEGA
jgi:segregation and condensation protein A